MKIRNEKIKHENEKGTSLLINWQFTNVIS